MLSYVLNKIFPYPSGLHSARQRHLYRHLFISLPTKMKHKTAQLSIPKLFSTFIRADPVMCSHSYFISCSFKKVKRLVIRQMYGNTTDATRTHTLNFQQSPHRIHCANMSAFRRLCWRHMVCTDDDANVSGETRLS